MSHSTLIALAGGLVGLIAVFAVIFWLTGPDGAEEGEGRASSPQAPAQVEEAGENPVAAPGPPGDADLRQDIARAVETPSDIPTEGFDRQADGLGDSEPGAAGSLDEILLADPELARAVEVSLWRAAGVAPADALTLNTTIEDLAILDLALVGQEVDRDLRDEHLVGSVDVAALDALGDIAAQDRSLARTVAASSWFADGLAGIDQFTLYVVQDLAREDLLLARRMVDSPEIANGLSAEELAEFTGSDNYYYERIQRDHPDLAEALLQVPWVADSVNGPSSSALPGEPAPGLLAAPLLDDHLDSDALHWLSGIAKIDTDAAQRLSEFPWFNDGISEQERWALSFIYRAGAGRWGDPTLPSRLVALPWVADDITLLETWALNNIKDMARAEARAEAERGISPTLVELLLSQPWFRDDLTDEEAGVIEVMFSCPVWECYLDLISEAPARSETLPRPWGDLKIIVVQRSAHGPIDDEVFREIGTVVEVLEDFMGRPWPAPAIVVLMEPHPTATSWYRWGTLIEFGVHIRMTETRDMPRFLHVLRHELAHYYVSYGAFWSYEGGAQFLTSYVSHVTENRDLRERQAAVSDPCPSAGSNIAELFVAMVTREISGRGYVSCSYPMGERFFLGVYNELGREVVQSSFRQLWPGLDDAPREVFTWHVEEFIYQTFLSNTPPGRHDDFRELYDRLHGRPLVGFHERIDPADRPPLPPQRAILPPPAQTSPETDRAALVAFTNTFQCYSGWWVDTTWSLVPHAYWPGIGANDDGRVNYLDGRKFTECQRGPLNGWLPPELGHLTHLEIFDMVILDPWKRYPLTGSIPPELGYLTSLRSLTLVNNEITGPIPPELANLSGLDTLFLESNQLTGPIPLELGNLTGLGFLSLRGNQLTGPIPPELGNLTGLRRLYLFPNLFTGCVPEAVGALMNPGEFVPLAACGDSPTAPPPQVQAPPEGGTDRAVLFTLYHATGGDNWKDSTNWLSDAPLDEWYGVSTDGDGRVIILNLEANALTGQLPPELANLTELIGLSLHSNLLSGPLPPGLFKLPNLRTLDLNHNQFTGCLESGAPPYVPENLQNDNTRLGQLPPC